MRLYGSALRAAARMAGIDPIDGESDFELRERLTSFMPLPRRGTLFDVDFVVTEAIARHVAVHVTPGQAKAALVVHWLRPPGLSVWRRLAWAVRLFLSAVRA